MYPDFFLAEQPIDADRLFFQLRPNRRHRVRLASAAELEEHRHRGENIPP